jgi:N-acetylglucosamine-6-phosphate deacetylase
MRLGVASAVIDGHLVAGDIELSDGVISEVGLSGGSGKHIALPGFIDVHTHGYGGVDFARASDAEMDEASTALAATGVTGFQPSLVTMGIDETVTAIEVHAAATYPGARFLGSHLEGPFLSPRYPGAHRPDLILEPDVEVARHMVRAGNVAQMTMAPELEGALPLLEFLIASGVQVAAGHSDATASQAAAFFDAGGVAITHVFNASRPMRHRDPGVVGAALARSDVYITAIFDGVHLSREAAVIVARSAGKRLVAITDAMAAAGASGGNHQLGSQIVTVRGLEVRLADGTIASSVLTMDTALRNLVELGLGLGEASVATSGAAAAMVNRPDLGSLRPGNSADVVVVDESLDVIRTLVGGLEVFSA